KYKFADIIKPNLKEAYAAAKLGEKEDLDKVAKIILKKTKISNLLITRSQHGISLFSEDNKRKDFPVSSKEVKDVTGAGDTVLAMLCIAVANKLELEHACQLSNIAASIAIEHIGCHQITLNEFAKRLLEHDIENKIFDFSHLFALKKVLENKKFSLLALSSRPGLNTAVFRAIKNLSVDQSVIIYILDPKPDDDFVELLSSLNEVDFIILKNENLNDLLNEIIPEHIYVMKKDKPLKLKNHKDLVLEKFNEPALN
ncbi:MAG: PfkB family carbohydrate kinase, partial [Parachlamydiales bacterium]